MSGAQRDPKVTLGFYYGSDLRRLGQFSPVVTMYLNGIEEERTNQKALGQIAVQTKGGDPYRRRLPQPLKTPYFSGFLSTFWDFCVTMNQTGPFPVLKGDFMCTDKLISALKVVEEDSTVAAKDWLTDGENGTLPESIERVLSLANEVLIDSKGRCNFQAHSTLEAAGHPVSCGERDSFGWLTGVISTSKGNISYG